MTKICLRPHVPVDLELAYTEGKPVESKWKGPQMMFSTVDGRVLYVPIEAGHEIQNRLRDLGIQRGERILICEQQERQGAEVLTSYEVHRIERAVGEQRDGTFVVPAQPGATRDAPPIAAPNGNSTAVRNGDAPRLHLHLGWCQTALEEINAMTDLYSAAKTYSREKYGDQIPEGAIQAFVVAAFRR